MLLVTRLKTLRKQTAGFRRSRQLTTGGSQQFATSDSLRLTTDGFPQTTDLSPTRIWLVPCSVDDLLVACNRQRFVRLFEVLSLAVGEVYIERLDGVL